MIEAIPALVPVVIGLTYATSKFTNKKYAPLVALILGVGLSFLYQWGVSGELILSGLVTGLSSMGLYSGVKAVAK